MRAAGYVRVSTARQASDGLSLEAQERTVREHIERQGWELAEVYVERGVSGRTGDRAELGRLLGSLDSLDRLVIPKLDRLGRSNRHLFQVFDALEGANVELVSVSDQLDTSTPTGRLMRGLLALMAEFESDLIGERVRSVAGGRVEGGKHHGRAPFGYYSEAGALTPYSPEVPVVREAFEAAAAGVSQREIARRLNARGLKPQRAKDWSQASVGKALRNVTYKGEVRINGRTFSGDHEGIVPPELWDKVARLRGAATRTPGGPRGRPTIGRHLFVRGLLRCGHCGGTMLARAARRPKGGLTETYVCNSKVKYGVDHCDMGTIPRAALDAPVFAYFERVVVDVGAMRAQLRAQTDRRLAEGLQRLKGARRTLKEVEAAREELPDKFIAREIEAATWARMEAGLQRREESASLDVTAVEEETERLAAASASADIEGEASSRLAEVKAAIAGEVADAGDLNAVRAALSRLFDVFEVYQVAQGATAPPAAEREIIEAQAREVGEAAEGVIQADGWLIQPHPTVATVEELAIPIRLLVGKNKASGGLTT